MLEPIFMKASIEQTMITLRLQYPLYYPSCLVSINAMQELHSLSHCERIMQSIIQYCHSQMCQTAAIGLGFFGPNQAL